MVTDAMFDANSKQLVELIKSSEGAFCASRWHYIFRDFDGFTGFDLYGKLNSEDKNSCLQLAEWLVQKFCGGAK